MNFIPTKIEAASPEPGKPVKLGSEDHKILFCRTLLDTHDPYTPALIDWPTLEPETQARIVSLPIWDMAVQTEGRTGLFVATFGETLRDPVIKAAVEMDAFEEKRHKIVLADMVDALRHRAGTRARLRTPARPGMVVHALGLFGMHRQFLRFRPV